MEAVLLDSDRRTPQATRWLCFAYEEELKSLWDSGSGRGSQANSPQIWPCADPQELMTSKGFVTVKKNFSGVPKLGRFRQTLCWVMGWCC